MDNGFLYLYLLIIVGFVFYIKYREQKSREGKELPYKKKGELMTKAEKEFFDVLEKVVNNRYYIIPQVKISNLAVVSGTKNYKTYLNKIDRKTVDFVLFDKQFLPILVIELDDSSHDSEIRKERDRFVNRIMNKIELKIIHIRISSIYNLRDIEEII
ncbi:MAG: DUF2726 domain-containing protein [Candidatus Paceibacterota bacterium]|jgi:hypothetical protein